MDDNEYLSHNGILKSFRHLSEWWIDDTGVWHFRQFPDAYYSQVLVPSFPENVKNEGLYYRHLGLIKISIIGNSVFLAWDIHSVAKGAMDSLFEFLRSKGHYFKRFELQFCFGGWRRERFGSSDKAFQRIWQLNAYRHTAMANSIILSRQENLDADRYDTLIREGLKAWNNGVFKSADHSQQFVHSFSPYILMFKRDHLSDQISLSYVGLKSAYTKALGKDWANLAISQPFYSDTPDEDYSSRIGKVYAEVLESGEPRLDHIMALIHTDDNDPVWWPYQRLLLPLEDMQNQPVLLCLSTIKHDIGIPFMAGA